MKEVAVVIPIYQESLNELEKVSFDSIVGNFGGKYPIVIVKPCSLNVESIVENNPNIQTENFEDKYFESLKGYNELMLSVEFYERFKDYKYILIAQTDVYVFRDELEEWCKKDYDYIGAPWLVKPIFKFPLVMLYSFCKRMYCKISGAPNSQETNYKVGNGGFSLRKVSSHIAVLKQLDSVVYDYLNFHRPSLTKNEDVFFALEPLRAGMDFKFPSVDEALLFSVDKYPKLSVKRAKGKLPMGCHGWYKKKMIKFWSPIIFKDNM